MELFVSVKGDDRNPGSEREPFATLHRAKAEIREIRGRKNTPVVVWVREGTYYFDEALVLGPEDSGSETNPVTYAAYREEKVTLSGGSRIIGEWLQYKNGIMMCKLPELAEKSFTQLFVNGKRQTRARYPNIDSACTDRRGYIAPVGADKWPHSEIYFNPDSFTDKRWTHPEEAVLHVFPYNYWGNMQFGINDIDWDSNIIKLGNGGWQLNMTYQGSAATGINCNSLFFIENVFEELDSPNEWYYDKRKSILYYMPSSGTELDSAIIEVSGLSNIIAVRGTKNNPVQFISFDGFRIAHTEATYMEKYDDPSLGDWSVARNGAIMLEGAENCKIQNCFFDAVGGNGVFINNYAERVHVSDNHFSEAGESAVCLVGKSHLLKEGNYACSYCGAQHQWRWGEPSDEIPAQCLISNNLIHDIGVFGKQTAGVFLSLSRMNTVSHNHIFNIPRAAICINDGLWGGHIIEFNDIHDTVRETGDHGPFNSWGRENYWCSEQSHGGESHPAGDVKKYAKYTTIIRNNRFRDNKGWGIDLDDGSSNYHVYNNLCIGISIKLREGDFRTIENNIFINGANSPGFHIGYENNSDRFIKNIIVMDSRTNNSEVDINFTESRKGGSIYDIIGPPEKGSWFMEWDYNMFMSNLGRFRSAVHFLRDRSDKEFTLEEWQKMGFDKHSIYGDPTFIDLENGDYRVSDNSAVLKLGFKNFDMQSFGIVEKNLIKA